MRAMIFLTIWVLMASCTSNSRTERGKRNEQAIDMQQVLAESGFVESMLNTPEKVADVRDLPQREVIRQGEGDSVRYIYVDVALCGCVYSGDANAYERYRQRIGRQATRANNYEVKQLQSVNKKVIRPIGRYD